MSSGNKILSVGPYSGMTLDEVVAADPWHILAMYNTGGNHGISASMMARAERLAEEYRDDQVDPHDEYEELMVSSAYTLGYDLHLDYWEEVHD